MRCRHLFGGTSARTDAEGWYGTDIATNFGGRRRDVLEFEHVVSTALGKTRVRGGVAPLGGDMLVSHR